MVNSDQFASSALPTFKMPSLETFATVDYTQPLFIYPLQVCKMGLLDPLNATIECIREFVVCWGWKAAKSVWFWKSCAQKFKTKGDVI